MEVPAAPPPREAPLPPLPPHPLDPLTAEETLHVSSILKAEGTAAGKSLHIKHITLVEPPKGELRNFLRAERQGGFPQSDVQRPVRRASCLYYHRGTADLFLAVVNVDTGSIESIKLLESHYHGHGDVEEVMALRSACLNHPLVLEEVRKTKLPPEYTLCCDTWPYGRENGDPHPRYSQCYLYYRANRPGANYYDNPLSISPVFDIKTKELIKTMYLPTGADAVINSSPTYRPHVNREYHHDLRSQPTRGGLKPLLIHQPEGPSFQIDGHLITWQKWRFRLGYNWREGMVLHDVTYDSRELFHRLSLTEMFVPYGDPRSPYNRKSVFDLGDIGAGYAANDLSLGCDCLGVIKYFSFVLTDASGGLIEKHNAVCMHEVDDGIGWKHTDKDSKQVSIVRSRVLVLQSIITVGNYEYIFLWHFDQAAGLHYKIQATGILATGPIDGGVQVPWGTVVNDGVMAAYHQHIFCLRIDPCLDGDNNTLVEEDSIPMPLDPETNPNGIGFVATRRAVSESGPSDQAPNRVHKIINAGSVNPTSRRPVAYAIHSPMRQMLLAHPSSWHARRAKYATHPFWVTAHRDGELYPAGDYTYQSLPDDAVPAPPPDATTDARRGDLGAWAARRDPTDGEDIVVWHAISLTHNPRTEDYPVMPCDTMTVSLKPSGFFEWNPALDVPQSVQAVNKSVLVEEKGCCGSSPSKAKL